MDGLWAVAGYTKYGSIGWGPCGVDPDRRMVNREDVSRTVIKPIMADQAEVHVEEAIMTVKIERAGLSIFVAGHHP